jgi:hypothetical protein
MRTGGRVSRPCPDCEASAQAQGVEFDGGYLHDSVEYQALLHCNFCGAYYQRVSYTAPLRRIPAIELREHRRVS